MMQQLCYEFVLQAATPIAHHSEVFGNSAVLMDRKIRQTDGSFVRVPIVTGDTMRHGMREAAAYALLDAAGLLDQGRLGEAALRLLFAGGMVTGKGDASTISLERYRQMSDLIPSIALFGGCCDNRVIPGRLVVDDARLICIETAHQLPDWINDWLAEHRINTDSSRAHVEEVQRVRMDPTLDPGKRKLLTSDAAASVQKRLTLSETAHVEDDAAAVIDSQSSMMPRRFETIVQGSLLYWSVGATVYSELERDTFHVALGAFLGHCMVGGKRGTGHGRLGVVTARDIAVRRPSDASRVLDLAAPMGQMFYAHVRERAVEIAEFLGAVNA
jgi:hypothetical protein